MTAPIAARHRRLAGGAAVASLLVGGLVAVAAGGASSPVAAPSIVPGAVHAQDAVRLRKPSPIVLSAPGSVQAGGRIRFDGDVVVKARKPRRVEVAERKAGRWRLVARTTSKRNGTFSLRIAAGGVGGTRVFRAEAPAVRGLAGLRTGTLKVKVAKAATMTTGPVIPGDADFDDAEGLPAGYVGAGPKSDWSYLFDQEPDSYGSRWNPCMVINWSYNPTGEAYGALADVRRAVAKISGVSGMKFKYQGSTSYRYLGGDHDLDGLTDQMVVGWANKNQFTDLAPDQYGDAVGIGGGTAQPVSGLDVDLQMVQGYLTLDNDKGIALARGFNRSGWGQVMMHEILHALGLGHAESPSQLMFGTAGSQNFQFGAGDITGMNEVGAPAGCMP
jgi:hypothetical protein